MPIYIHHILSQNMDSPPRSPPRSSTQRRNPPSVREQRARAREARARQMEREREEREAELRRRRDNEPASKTVIKLIF
jgi:hypothetical protein